MNAKELNEQAEQLYTKRSNMLLLWQEIAENFYPERADFTFRRQLGVDFASNLMSSYPVVVRRELTDQITTMLRPTQKAWFEMVPPATSKDTNDGRRWLQWASTIQRKAMYDRKALFTRATKQGDADYSAFGQCGISARLNKTRDRLLYQCWHLRDLVWMEDESGEICFIGRKWKPTALDLTRLFPGKIHRDVSTAVSSLRPFEEFECIHLIVKADMYNDDARGRPYWSIYYDRAHEHLMEAVPVWNKEYIIPRWQTVSGSQYAYSPATVAGLPDARLIQAMTYTLLEAGEKVTNPPMVATIDAVRSDIAIYAGGTIWVDREYDERTGEALRAMNIDAKGMPIGIEMLQDSRQMLAQAFYINKLTLPTNNPEMTAYEAGQRVQEYIRGALPLFEPMEADYNGELCELTADLLLRNGAFGSPLDIPKELLNRDPHATSPAQFEFRFQSPLHDAIEQQKGQKFLEIGQYIAAAVQLDPNAAAVPDAVTGLREVLDAVGAPATWINSPEKTDAVLKAHLQQQQQAQTLAQLEQGSKVIQNLSSAQAARVPAMAA